MVIQKVSGLAKAIETHARTHGLTPEYTCAKCGEFTTKNYSGGCVHQAKCTGPKGPKTGIFVCEVEGCTKRFDSSRGLGQHRRHVHPPECMERRQLFQQLPGVADTRGNTRYSPEEVDLILSSYEGGKNAVQITGLLPGRTVNGIEKKMTAMGLNPHGISIARQIQARASTPQHRPGRSLPADHHGRAAGNDDLNRSSERNPQTGNCSEGENPDDPEPVQRVLDVFDPMVLTAEEGEPNTATQVEDDPAPVQRVPDIFDPMVLTSDENANAKYVSFESLLDMSRWLQAQEAKIRKKTGCISQPPEAEALTPTEVLPPSDAVSIHNDDPTEETSVRENVPTPETEPGESHHELKTAQALREAVCSIETATHDVKEKVEAATKCFCEWMAHV